METTEAAHVKLCLKMGFPSMAHVHELVLRGQRMGSGFLIKQGLTATVLHQFGYSDAILKKLGYAQQLLEEMRAAEEGAASDAVGTSQLSGNAPAPAPAVPVVPAVLGAGAVKKARRRSIWASAPLEEEAPPQVKAPEPRQTAPAAAAVIRGQVEAFEIYDLMKKGHNAGALRAVGITLKHCRVIRMSHEQLKGLCFPVEELAAECTLHELLGMGYGAGELKAFFGGAEFYNAGCTAETMRLAGFGIGDLMRFGYNDHQICCAGYHTGELMFNGISPSKHR